MYNFELQGKRKIGGELSKLKAIGTFFFTLALSLFLKKKINSQNNY